MIPPMALSGNFAVAMRGGANSARDCRITGSFAFNHGICCGLTERMGVRGRSVVRASGAPCMAFATSTPRDFTVSRTIDALRCSLGNNR